MLNDLFYIVWDFDPVMFSIGSVDIRYYGLTWALTILLGERFFSYFARREGFGPQIVETGFIWMEPLPRSSGRASATVSFTSSVTT